jgi:hypothetical protein
MRSNAFPTPHKLIAAAASIAQPATAEQALEMLDLMLADVIAQANGIMAGWSQRWPLDDEDLPHAKAQHEFSKNRLMDMARDYAAKHGKLDVPLMAFGSDYATMRAAIRPVMEKLADAKNSAQQH